MVNENKLDFLKKARLMELNQAMSYFQKSGRVLEIGAGTGWQARLLSGFGFKVEAIDVYESRHRKNMEWNVVPYDGYRIPFEDQSFNIVFSSNVLEHIEHIGPFQEEIKRVLKNDGVVVHVLPTTSWRVLTTVTHFLQLVKSLFMTERTKDVGQTNEKHSLDFSTELQNVRWQSKLKRLKYILPTKHGVLGNAITEMYYFSESRWSRFFRSHDWEIVSIESCQYLYSGHAIWNLRVSWDFRRFLGKIFGPTCRLYVLKKREL